LCPVPDDQFKIQRRWHKGQRAEPGVAVACFQRGNRCLSQSGALAKLILGKFPQAFGGGSIPLTSPVRLWTGKPRAKVKG
jgi:hypothetical protein